MCVSVAAERCESGTPMPRHLLPVDAPNRAILRMEFFISARLVRAFVCSYPMDRILWASEQCCCPVNGILIEISRAFTVQSRLCYRKHRSLKHPRVFEQWSIFNPAFAVRDATSHVPTAPPVAPAANSKRHFRLPPNTRHVLLPARVWPFSRLLHRPFYKAFSLPDRFWSLWDLLRSSPSLVLFFGRLQHHPLTRLQKKLTSETFFENYTACFKLDNFKTAWPSGDFCHNLHFLSFLVVYLY